MTKENKQFDEMLSIIYNDMMSRKGDKSVKRMKTINSINLPNILPAQDVAEYVAKSAVTYPELYEKFKGGEWDHKVPAKRVTNSYYHNEIKNAEGKPAAIFGSKFPGDDKNIYDHDLWGNISYGYTMKAAGFNELESRGGAVADDVLQSLISGNFDYTDDPMVKFGMALYDKYEGKGKVMSEEDLRREVLANKDILRRYKDEDLTLRRGSREDGDTLQAVADRNNISVETLKSKNPLLDDNKQTINRPLLPNKEERAEGAVLDKYRHLYKEEASKELQLNKEKLLRAIEENDNKKTDILYKHPSQISESEVRESMRYAGYETKDPEIRKLLDGKNQEWFNYYHGRDEAKEDATGRIIAEEAKYKAPEEVSEVKTKDNIPMSVAFKKVAEESSALGVRSLQKGLNELSEVKLKEDGDLGPKTTLGLKDILAKNGLNEVSKSIKYGGFATMLEDNRQQTVDKKNLNKMMTTLRPQDGGLFLQQGLNRVGEKKEGYERLKEDNDIGDKTTETFNRIKEEDEQNLSIYAKENIAKEIEKTREQEELERQKEYEREQRELEKQRQQEEQEAEKQRQLEEEQRLEQMQNQSLQSASMIQ